MDFPWYADTYKEKQEKYSLLYSFSLSFERLAGESNDRGVYGLFYARIAVIVRTFANSSVIITIRGAIDRRRHRKKFIAPDKEERTYNGRWPIDTSSNAGAMSMAVIKVDATRIIPAGCSLSWFFRAIATPYYPFSFRKNGDTNRNLLLFERTLSETIF